MSNDENSRKADTNTRQTGGGLKRRDLLLSGSSLVAASALAAVGLTSTAQAQQPTPSPAPAGQRPNIVVIMGDDIGIWNIGAYHRGMMAGRTPSLDKVYSVRCRCGSHCAARCAGRDCRCKKLQGPYL